MEEDVPFQLDDFLGSMLNFRGVLFKRNPQKKKHCKFHDLILINVLFLKQLTLEKNISCGAYVCLGGRNQTSPCLVLYPDRNGPYSHLGRMLK